MANTGGHKTNTTPRGNICQPPQRIHGTHKCNNQDNNRVEHTIATQKQLIYHGPIYGQPTHRTRGSKTPQ
eukprot:472798-Ditylum_brightwellii.AAC.1